MVGDFDGEGMDIFFPMPPDMWVDSFFDVFYEVEIENLSGMEIFVTEFSQDTGEVPKVSHPLIPGDANFDGTVDLQDFGILKTNFGGPGGWAEGDFNADDTVDLQDFGLLKANFGAGETAVPEPMTLMLLAGGAFLTLLRTRKR